MTKAYTENTKDTSSSAITERPRDTFYSQKNCVEIISVQYTRRLSKPVENTDLQAISKQC